MQGLETHCDREKVFPGFGNVKDARWALYSPDTRTRQRRCLLQASVSRISPMDPSCIAQWISSSRATVNYRLA